MDENEAIRIDPVKCESGTIKCALFEAGKILANPDERRFAAGGKARSQCQSETGRGRGIAGAGGGDLMQRASG